MKCYLRFTFLISATQRLSKTAGLQVDPEAEAHAVTNATCRFWLTPKEVVGFDITTLTAKPTQQASICCSFVPALSCNPRCGCKETGQLRVEQVEWL